jgi:murein DD-endopeptidase MepM/ murein hydrolase activator NlpD
MVMAHFKHLFVKVNELCFEGQNVGIMGNSGYANGVHCHLEVYIPDDPEGHIDFNSYKARKKA